jgi:Asparagine synthase (glutamine-hydrolyzing)
MCGICGQLRFDRHAVKSQDLNVMMSKIARRGPDASGQWADGKIGLAINVLALLIYQTMRRNPWWIRC